MNLRLERKQYHEDQTIGELFFNGEHVCYTLELPWKDNVRRESCIPPGKYRMVPYKSPAHGHCLLVLDVPDRSMIEFHSGNTVADTDGCILPGLKNCTYWVEKSRAAMNKLLALVPNSGATLEIVE